MTYHIQARDFTTGWMWLVGDDDGYGIDMWHRVIPPLSWETYAEAEQAAMLLILRQPDSAIRYFVKEKSEVPMFI